MAEEFKNFVGGQWIASSDGRTFEQRNPADLNEVTGVWPACTPEDAAAAVDAAQAAYPQWSGKTVFARAEYLKKALRIMVSRRDDIARVITQENGKTLAESLAEVDSAAAEMEYQIYEGLRLIGETVPSAHEGVFAYSLRVPLGVAAVISPWNFPLNVLGRKLTPALMAGNCCVMKPASLTPKTALKFMELFIEADLPAGVLNFITGGGSAIGNALISHPAVRAISFTGSTEVGRAIHERASKHMVKTQMEMGGKNPLVVLEDADIAEAAAAAARAAFACAGQWCTSTSRAIVVGRAYEPFMEALLRIVSGYVVGNGMAEGVTMGPVCGTEQLKNILRYIELGAREGANLAVGGHRLTGTGFDRGYFIEPTVFTEVTPEMTIAREEIFGPVLSVMRAGSFDEAVKIANSVDFGLASSVYTNDLSRALGFVERTQAGLVHVNLMTALKEPQLSFGGVGASGIGLPESGHTGLEFFTEHKVAYIKYR